MRTLLVATGLAFTALAASPAQPAFTSINKTLAASCAQSIVEHRRDWDAVGVCDLALGRELMTRDMRVATLVNRGILRMVRGEMPRANRDFHKAIELDPREPEAWLNLGVSHLASGHAVIAQQSANRALDLGTRRPAVAYYIRGLALEMDGNLPAAYADLVRARDLEPGWSEPTRQLSRYQVVSR